VALRIDGILQRHAPSRNHPAFHAANRVAHQDMANLNMPKSRPAPGLKIKATFAKAL
jgi:hypothetical protein